MDPIVFKEFGKLFVRFGTTEKDEGGKIVLTPPNDFRNGKGYRFRDSYAWETLVAIVERKSDEGYQLIFVFPGSQILSPLFKTEVELKGWRNVLEVKIKAVMIAKEVAVDKDGVGENVEDNDE